eukprot:UN18799
MVLKPWTENNFNAKYKELNFILKRYDTVTFFEDMPEITRLTAT